ncbi:MAG: hypothetical protein A2145_04400 [candidate division Zixibacteria bacterium RBG_16_40_9]|nr:MAG: hypothetical protein A2145_04400 [candidate division Zixibacteria bacterium RBG_16_40_9]
MFSHIPRNIVLLGIASLLTDISSDMILPILPIYLTQQLKISPIFLGLIEGIANSAVSFFTLSSGWLSDRFQKRKIWISVGYSLSALGKPTLALVTVGWQALFIRFMDRMGKGIRTSPRDALISETAEAKFVGKAFGFHRTLDSAGAILGPLLAFLILPLLNQDYQKLFLIAFIPAFLSCCIIIFWLKEKKSVHTHPDLKTLKLKEFLAFDEKFKYLILAIGIFSLSNASDTFLFLKAHSAGVKILYLPLLWVVMNISYTLFSFPAGTLSDRLGRPKLILFGFIIYSLSYLGFAFATAAYQIFLLFFLYGIYYGISDGLLRALVSDLVPAQKKGTAFGIYHFVIGVTVLPASLIFGFLWQSFSPPIPFLFSSVISLASALILYLTQTN